VGRLTAAADIYSLAKSFYTVIGGRTPSQFIRRPITSLPDTITHHPWAESLLTVLRRATAEQSPDRYATVIEFWSELANVATKTRPVSSFVTVEEEATRVRPKDAKVELEVAPTNLPARPEQPEFASLLTNSTANLPTSMPVAEKRKIVVNFDVPKPTPAPVIKPEPTQPPVTPRRPKTPASEPAMPLESFMAPMWRRVAVALLALLFLATLVSVYRYAREKRAASAATNTSPGPTSTIFGEQLEVLAPDLNVRSGPGPGFDKLGAVTRGSKHKVLSKAPNGWIQIEVSEWSPNYEHGTQKQGWINGDARFVSITSRGWF
jgi:hypothetical protein